MSISDYFSPEARTERVEGRAKDRAARRKERAKREKARKDAGGVTFGQVGRAARDVGLGLLGLTPKDKARARRAKKSAAAPSYSASGYVGASAGTDKGGLLLAGLAAAAAVAYGLQKKED